MALAGVGDEHADVRNRRRDQVALRREGDGADRPARADDELKPVQVQRLA